MSRKNKAARAYFHQNPDATPKDAWDAAWANNQSTFHAKSMQNLVAKLQAEREKVRVLREAIIAALPVLDGPEFRVLDAALQATAQEGE
tara:strand:- start:2958 stop:3224 length:267 start_codon:yes stop_codon:yes gene_type:complete